MSILVTRSSLPPLEEYVNEIQSIWQNHWLTNMGEKYFRLQEALREFLAVEEIELLVNGHMALEMTLQAMELTGEVITTPFTFASTTHAIVRSGLTPVFADIDGDDWTLDVEKLKKLVTPRTSAIMPVHVYGNVCHVAEIAQFAGNRGLKVIYDAAHAFGETYKGQGIGTFGDASCFSFHATKVFNTIEGGAVCFAGGMYDFGEKLRHLRNFGIRDAENVDGVGGNAKLNEFSAAMGLCNLKHLPEYLAARRKAALRYRRRLEGVPGLKLSRVQPDVETNYAYMPVVFDAAKFGAGRDEVAAALADHGIMARKYFYPLTNTFSCYRGLFDAKDTPVALDVSRRVLTLPLYAGLTEEEVDMIADIVLAAGKRE